MFRAIAVLSSGEGREVLGLPAAVVGVYWRDFTEAMPAVVWLQGFAPGSFFPTGNGWHCEGVGESFRMVEVFLVDADTGRKAVRA